MCWICSRIVHCKPKWNWCNPKNNDNNNNNNNNNNMDSCNDTDHESSGVHSEHLCTKEGAKSLSRWHIWTHTKWEFFLGVNCYSEVLHYLLQQTLYSIWFLNSNKYMFHLCWLFLMMNVWQPTLTASKFITVVSTVIVVVAHIGGINAPSIFT